MPELRIITSGPFQTNSYLIGTDGSDELVLIDAPPDCHAEVRKILGQSSRRLAALLVTHPHFDHTLDCGSFGAEGVPIYAHPDAVGGIERPDAMGFFPVSADPDVAARVFRTVSGGDRLGLAGLEIVVLYVPGHAPGSVAFVVPALNACFAGDVLFNSSVGRTDLPGGDFDMLAESIQNRLYSLPDEMTVYPGHGPATTVGHEKRSNPFVRG